MSMEEIAKGAAQGLLEQLGNWTQLRHNSRKPVEMTFIQAETWAGVGSTVPLIYRIKFLPGAVAGIKRYTFDVILRNPKGKQIVITRILVRFPGTNDGEEVTWDASGRTSFPGTVELLNKSLQMGLAGLQGYTSPPRPTPITVGPGETTSIRITTQDLSLTRGSPEEFIVFGSHWKMGTRVAAPRDGNSVPLAVQLTPET